jgi:pimeloyl-ACP methyl ester carboxylesterase
MDLRLGGMVAEVDGDGPAIVAVHGLGGTSSTFAPLLPLLAGWRVIRPDLPGAGRSAGVAGRSGIDGLARAVVDLMRAAGTGPALLVAHSMGTLVAQAVAASRPELVAGLVLFGAILEPAPAARETLRARAAEAEARGMAGIAAAVSAASLGLEARERNPAAVAFVRESLLRQPPSGYAAHARALAEAGPAGHARIRCPVRLMTGADDPVAPPAMARGLAGRLGDARVEIVAGCGHWPTVEAPEAVGRLVAETAATCLGPASRGETGGHHA